MIAAPARPHLPGPRVVNVREGDPVLGADGPPHDDLAHVVELVPVLLLLVLRVAEERLELRPARYGDVERLSREEVLAVEEVEVVLVERVREEGRREAVEVGHDRGGETPRAVGRAVAVNAGDYAGLNQVLVVIPIAQGLVLVEPGRHVPIVPLVRAVLVPVELHPHGLSRLYVQHVVGIVQRGLLVVKGGKAHALEVLPVPLLPPHHGPRGSPLGDVHGLDDLGYLVHEGYGSRHVVQYRHGALRFPGHRHVLQQLEDGVGAVLERPEVDALVLRVPLRGHVPVVGQYLADVFGGKKVLLGGAECQPAAVRVPLGLQLGPAPGLLL